MKPRDEFRSPSLCQGTHIWHLVGQPWTGLPSQGRQMHRSGSACGSTWFRLAPLAGLWSWGTSSWGCWPAVPCPQGQCLWSPRKREPCGRHWLMWDSRSSPYYSADHCVKFLHMQGSNQHTHIPFHSTVQSLKSVSLDWNQGVAGPHTPQSLMECCGLNASVPSEFMFGIPAHLG